MSGIMIRKRILLVIILLLCLVALIQGQNVDFTSKNFSDKDGLNEAMKNIRRGDDLFAYKKGWLYSDALEFYLKANTFNPDNAVLNFKIGACYLNSNNKAQSLTYFLKAKELNPKVDMKINYAIAQAYQYNMQFDEAIATYTEYLDKDIPAKEKETQASVIKKKILECKNGKQLVATPVGVTITNLGSELNSKYNDYTPLTVKIDSFIIFTSRREEAEGKQIDLNTQDYFEDILISKREGSTWSKPVQLSSKISGTAHDAASALIYSGYTILIYKGLSGGGDVYESNLDENGAWTEPRPFAAMNTQWHESSACITNDGATAFVVSNRPDRSLGEHDIFIMHLNEDGTWTEQENLGLAVNSPYDEEGVFVSDDGNTLYFSSKGHNSMGGYDIFRTYYKDGQWTIPENMGYPINTPDDDMYPIAFGNPGYEEGYFTTVRPDGYGLKDICHYKFNTIQADLRSAADSTTADTTYNVDLYKGEPSDAFVNMSGQDSSTNRNIADNTNANNTNENNITINNENNGDRENVVKNETVTTDNNENAVNQENEVKNETVVTDVQNAGNNNTTVTENTETRSYISSDYSVVFHVQVGACRRQIPQRELKTRYPGNIPVEMVQHEGWYKYLIGRFDKYSEAKAVQRTCGTPDAWVVVYKNGIRVNIREVSDMLTYYANSALLFSILHI